MISRASTLRVSLLAALVAFLASLTAGTHSGPGAAEALGPISLQTYVSGLTSPVSITHAGDDRLFVVEKPGRIRVINGGALLQSPFLNVTPLVGPSPASEEGLLGLAFHPEYPATPYFYILYTNPSSDIVIARYRVSANENVADAGSGVTLLTIPHPTNTNHNGGQMAFGPDGYLYISIGDGGGAGDPANNAQNKNNLLGKILRLDVDQNVAVPPYHGIPASNPFAGATPGADQIWAFGLRNPWRFSFDRQTGDLLIGDVGQYVREEIDFEPSTSPGGVNYGWRIMEGFNCYINEGVGCGHASLTPPVYDYDQSNGDCSITGGFVYRGISSSYDGEYVFGDFCSGRIWHATPGATPWQRALLLDSSFLISTFGEDVNGELYLADYGGGTIQRLLLEDSDGDGSMDQVDNCPTISNPTQTNSDRNFIDQTPPSTQDDATWINSDGMGDACDTDDDNDGLPDTAEATGCNGSSALDPVDRDSDADRFLDGPECALGANPSDANSRPAIAACGASTDGDGDGVVSRIEVCHYNSNPASPNTDGDVCNDGRELASINGDFVVNIADRGLLSAEIMRAAPPPKLVNMDINKDGVLNVGDVGLLALRFGSCP